MTDTTANADRCPNCAAIAPYWRPNDRECEICLALAEMPDEIGEIVEALDNLPGILGADYGAVQRLRQIHGLLAEHVGELATEVRQMCPLMAAATEFTFRPDYGDVTAEFAPYDNPEHHDEIVLSWRGPSEEGGDPDRWVIKWRHHECWSRKKQAFVYENSAGNRTASFIADTRFALAEAVALVPGMLQRLQDVRIPELRRLVASWAERDAAVETEKR